MTRAIDIHDGETCAQAAERCGVDPSLMIEFAAATVVESILRISSDIGWFATAKSLCRRPAIEVDYPDAGDR